MMSLALLASVAWAGKELASFSLVDPDGQPTFRCDDKGNLVQVFDTYDTSGKVAKVEYEAKTRKGKTYSKGSLAEAVGADDFQIATAINDWPYPGGFDKKWLLVRIEKGNNFEFVMYKLGKKGAEKVASLTFPDDPVPYMFMYKKRIVLQTTQWAATFGDPNTYTFKMYTYKLKELKGKGGTTAADAFFWLGKSGAFATYSGTGNTNAAVKVFRN